jgi:uncharacterized protein YbjT (DUF2867 family)
LDDRHRRRHGPPRPPGRGSPREPWRRGARPDPRIAHARDALGPVADRVELFAADVRDPSSLAAAVRGADTVIAAIQGFGGREAGGIAAVDRDGNRHLIEAAVAVGARRFVLVSIHDASSTDGLALARAKAAVETALHATALTPIVVRPTAYMETWAGIIGGPILATGRGRVFGRGRNPINFVSATDVAGLVVEAAVDPALDGRTIEIIGPEDLTFDDVVERFSAALGRPIAAAHIPLPMLRLMSLALRPVKPVLAEQIAAAVVLDTTNRRARTAGRDPATIHHGATTFAEVIRALVASAPDRHTESEPGNQV